MQILTIPTSMEEYDDNRYWYPVTCHGCRGHFLTYRHIQTPLSPFVCNSDQCLLLAIKNDADEEDKDQG